MRQTIFQTMPSSQSFKTLPIPEGIKKVAFFHSHILWAPHFENELELILELQQKGLEVVAYVCNGVLDGCDQNHSHNLAACAKCMLKRKAGYFVLPKGIREIPIRLEKRSFSLHKGMSAEQLKETRYKSFDIGYAILSSLVSITRDPYLTVDAYYGDALKIAGISAALHDFFLDSLTQESPDLVFIFNGRFAYTRALVRACEALGIPYFTHERGANIHKYMLFENTMPHDMEYFQKLIVSAWHEDPLSEVEKERHAAAFFKNRKEGKPSDWYSFVDKQDSSIPITNASSNLKIGVFLSSEDEFFAIGDAWKRPLFSSQLEGLAYLKPMMEENSKVHWFIRMHPNSKGDIFFQNEVNKFAGDRVTVISPDSKVSSYQLLLDVDKVLVFGSTMGVEACFWGKPSINLDNAFYQNLNVAYTPNRKEDISSLVFDEALPPKPILGALMYGYFFNTFGYTFKYYEPEDFGDGMFMGKNINWFLTKAGVLRAIKRRFSAISTFLRGTGTAVN